MKWKWIFLLIPAVVFLAAMADFYMTWKHKKAVSISIIGGADGPTSIFLAGKVDNGFFTCIAAAAALLFIAAAVIVIIIKNKNL